MAVPTDDGISWYNRYACGLEPAPIDTIAIGTGTGETDPTRQTLRTEVFRADTTSSIVNLIPHSSDPSIIYAQIQPTGGLEIAENTKITEMGVFANGAPGPNDPATADETMVWYDVSSPVTFESGYPNKLLVPMDFSMIPADA